MKINICYDVVDRPHGGGNQFLKALREEFINRDGLYTDNHKDADIILFNSHHAIEKITEIKSLYPNKLFVHRVDGPIRLYNTMDDNRDFIVYHLNKNIADAVVFQSGWSRMANLNLGMDIARKPSTIICNAPDSRIFNSSIKKKENNKISLIATSWSDNIKKGFRYYDFLDKNLNYNKYDFFFAGRSPIEFENINMLGTLNSKQLAKRLQSCDIFVTASENDPCSNSLIEALFCGLPAVALNSGGHPEIIQKAGLFFETAEELLERLEDMSSRIDTFKKEISVKPIKEISSEYISFFNLCLQTKKS